MTATLAGKDGPTIGLKPLWDTVPRWKRRLLYGAAALGLFGVGRDAYFATGSGPAPEPPVGSVARAATPETGPALSGRETAGGGAGDSKGGTFAWGGAPGRLGLSFALAFLAALAIRWFLKAVLTAAAAAAAAVALLTHFGVIDPSRFGDLPAWAEALGPWLAEQTESLKTLIQGHLPSGAAGGAGLFLGLRK